MSTPKGTMPSANKMSPEIFLQPSDDFVLTPSLTELTERAMAYLQLGYAVHLSGPAGTGKTTLAMHIASRLGRPCTLLHGDDEMKSSDLVGKDAGYRKQSVRDNYVSSILKTEETVTLLWNSNRLTTACENGHTLIYDEFTRSPAAANNALLSVLEEKILNIPSSTQDKGYVQVHPDFRAIFTSNPEEYIGVHKTQDALLDRMITLEVAYQDRETEVAIAAKKGNGTREEIESIVDIVRSFREQLGGKCGPTVRAAIAIATICNFRGIPISPNNRSFLDTCLDVLYFNAVRQSKESLTRKDVELLVQRVLTKKSNGATQSARSLSSHASLLEKSALPTSDIRQEANVLNDTIGLASDVRTALGSGKSIELHGMDSSVGPSNSSPLALELSSSEGSRASRSMPRPPTIDIARSL